MSENELMIAEELRQPMAIGEVFAKSAMFPDVKSQSQAVVKILAGKELGLSPFESMASIYIVNGKLALTSKAMSGLVKRNKLYDYSVKELTDKKCSISFTKESSEVGVSTFTFEEAAKAGLVNKEVWKSYPRNMLFARALSNGCRWYCPEVISGYYSTEELDDLGEEVGHPTKTTVTIDVTGEVKDGTSNAQSTPQA